MVLGLGLESVPPPPDWNPAAVKQKWVPEGGGVKRAGVIFHIH